jgi:hypothetical protein
VVGLGLNFSSLLLLILGITGTMQKEKAGKKKSSMYLLKYGKNRTGK